MNLDMLKYRNLFPSDISEAAGFLLKVMALLPPIHEHAIRTILKPIICDDNIRGTLYLLENNQYIWKRKTAMGNFYAITSKTEKALDIDCEKKAHRNQNINLKPLYTNYLKGQIAANALLKFGAITYLRSWKQLDEFEQTEYLSKHNIDRRKFEWKISQMDCRTIDLLPRSIVNVNSVLAEMADGILNGRIPFTPPYNNKLYDCAESNLLKNARVYDTGKIALSKLSARYTKNGSSKFSKKEYEDLVTIRNQYEAAKKSCGVITYYNDIKPISLSVLDDNGIYVISLSKDEVSFGILDNARYGLSLDVLNTRLDYCVSLAEQLKAKPAITLYCLPESINITKKRIEKCRVMNRHNSPMIQWIEVAESRPPLRAETWKKIMSEV